MKLGNMLRLSPQQDFYGILAIFVAGTILNAIADTLKTTFLFVLVYHGLFALGLYITLPIWYVCRKKMEPISSVGITKKHWFKAIVIAVLFLLVSVPGRIIGKGLMLPEFNALIPTSLALVFSSCFEEVFFRGVLQTRVEKSFGVIPAIVFSGLTFSLYHLGYSSYRSFDKLLSLILVGIFFAITFQVTKNVLTSVIVNFFHAVVTFISANTFFNYRDGLISFIAAIIGVVIILLLGQKRANRSYEGHNHKSDANE